MRAGLGKAIHGILTVVLALASLAVRPAEALDIVLDDVAPDRLERQRQFIRNELPLPGTPDLSHLDERLKAQDLAEGRPIYIRIFKAESELELWMQNSKGTFSRLATYPICHWYGTLGPKLREGDKQSPEGFYRVGAPQTRLVGRWRKAFNLGFPNVFDQRLGRTGSYILIHGGCSSVGCFAMTDPVQDEIYQLARAALSHGQDRFSVHIFPFRMTAENLARHADHAGAETWADLKPAYDSFERTHVPPRVAVCGKRYKIADGLPGETGSTERRLAVLQPGAGAAKPSPMAAEDNGEADWQAPACRLDDEDRRIAFYNYTAAPITTSATGATEAVAAAPATPIGNLASVAGEAEAEVTLDAADEAGKAAEARASSASASDRPPAKPATHRQRRHSSGASARRAEIEAPRVRLPPRVRSAPQRPMRRAAGPAQAPRVSGVPAADGFGNSPLRGTQRISAHGS